MNGVCLCPKSVKHFVGALLESFSKAVGAESPKTILDCADYFFVRAHFRGSLEDVVLSFLDLRKEALVRPGADAKEPSHEPAFVKRLLRVGEPRDG